MTDLLPTVKVCVRFQHIFCRPCLISQDTDCNCCENALFSSFDFHDSQCHQQHIRNIFILLTFSNHDPVCLIFSFNRFNSMKKNLDYITSPLGRFPIGTDVLVSNHKLSITVLLRKISLHETTSQIFKHLIDFQLIIY